MLGGFCGLNLQIMGFSNFQWKVDYFLNIWILIEGPSKHHQFHYEMHPFLNFLIRNIFLKKVNVHLYYMKAVGKVEFHVVNHDAILASIIERSLLLGNNFLQESWEKGFK